MKKVLLALAVVAIIGMSVSTAEAGRGRYRRGYVTYGRAVPVVTVRPRYYAPVYVARPYGPVYGYYGPRTGVYVRSGGYYRGGGVIVNTPGFGLNLRF